MLANKRWCGWKLWVLDKFKREEPTNSLLFKDFCYEAKNLNKACSVLYYFWKLHKYSLRKISKYLIVFSI